MESWIAELAKSGFSAWQSRTLLWSVLSGVYLNTDMLTGCKIIIKKSYSYVRIVSVKVKFWCVPQLVLNETCKMDTFFLVSLALSMPIYRHFQSNGDNWGSIKHRKIFLYNRPLYKFFCSTFATLPVDSIWLEMSINWH